MSRKKYAPTEHQQNANRVQTEHQQQEGATSRPRRPQAPRVNVVVTREVIDRSERKDSSHCMIAEALKEAVPGARGIAVDLQTIRFTDKKLGLRYIYLTPRLAQIALVAFDQGIPTDPFSMTLRAAQVIKAGTAGNRSKPDPDNRPAMPDGSKTELVIRDKGKGTVPEVVGGSAPPTGPLTNSRYGGKRRAFGLRGLHL